MDLSFVDDVNQEALRKGFEVHQFKIGWYNEMVAKGFHLPYDYDTLALILLSAPAMFELNFIPYLKSSGWNEKMRDPVDLSIQEFISTLQQGSLKGIEADILYDYDLNPATRRPKILVQTAGHVAGAAYLYQQSDVSYPDGSTVKKQYPVSVHPLYGGWFAFRAVLVFPHHKLPSQMCKPNPPDSIPDHDDRIMLLRSFNEHWKDGQFRDVNKPQEKYGPQQMEYFNTPPKDRAAVIKKLLSS